jgi:endogenous inhibitor of DNA gyrase (YacG/DUF329 family)
VHFTCPTCRKQLEGTRADEPKLPKLPTLPFCSPRCRAADLGNWLNESYRISSPASEEDLDQGLPSGARAGEADPRRDEN